MGQTNDVQKRLQMKRVDKTHLGQFNELLRYVFQVTDQDLQKVGYKENELKQAKRPVLEKADVLGWFEGDRLVSQLAIYPMKVNIHGEIYEMGGVTGVGTYPEYANLGLMKKLMHQSLLDMQKRGQSISYLYPYSIPYYRKKGWEIISDVITFEIKDTQLPSQVAVPGSVKRTEKNHEDIITTYNVFAKKTHAAMIRDSLAWEEYFRWEPDELTAAIYYDENQNSQGYLFYWIAEEVFYLKELVFLTEEARLGLWNFISAHFSMITHVKGKTYTNEPIAFLLEDSEIVETIRPYYMARIVDIETFLKKYPFQNIENEKAFHFVVDDPLLDWNRGTFSLIFEDGLLKISKKAVGASVKLDIQTLTTMLLCYRRPRYLAKIRRIETDKETLRQLERILPKETPYFSDYF